MKILRTNDAYISLLVLKFDLKLYVAYMLIQNAIILKEILL